MLCCTILPALGAVLLPVTSGAQQKQTRPVLLPHSHSGRHGCYQDHIWSYLDKALQELWSCMRSRVLYSWVPLLTLNNWIKCSITANKWLAMTFECANYFSLSCVPTADYQTDQTLMLYKGHLMCLADPWPIFYTLKFLKFLLVHGVLLLQNHNTYYSWANFPHIYMNFVAPLSKLTLSVRNELVYGHTKCFSLKEGRIVLIMSYAEFSPNFFHGHDQWAVPVVSHTCNVQAAFCSSRLFAK